MFNAVATANTQLKEEKKNTFKDFVVFLHTSIVIVTYDQDVFRLKLLYFKKLIIVS